jgi:hypothetical protein
MSQAHLAIWAARCRCLAGLWALGWVHRLEAFIATAHSSEGTALAAAVTFKTTRKHEAAPARPCWNGAEAIGAGNGVVLERPCGHSEGLRLGGPACLADATMFS